MAEVQAPSTTRTTAPSSARATTSARAALAAFVVLVVVAFPLLLEGLAKKRWFISDEWDFLAMRSLGNVGGLFRPHNGHWVTLPIVAWRILYAVFGLNSYRPYQALVIGVHLLAVVLLRVIMRRCGVGPWTATVTAGLLILFGAGQQDIVEAFQITFVGSFVFGLIQLLLADHDGGWNRRDWLGLLAGVGALMCSGIGLAMVVVVGVAVLLRRGWRAALGHVVPLVGVWVVWWQVEGRPSASVGAPHRSLVHVVVEIVKWVAVGGFGGLHGLGYYRSVGVALAATLIVGVGLAVRSRGWTWWRSVGSPVVALVAGCLAFLVSTGVERWYLGTAYSLESRYLYLTAAFLLPALAVAADAIAERWPTVLPVILVLFLIGVPGNVSRFRNGRFVGNSFADHRLVMLSIPFSPLAADLPPRTHPGTTSDMFVTLGSLMQARAQGKLRYPGKMSKPISNQVTLRLGFIQTSASGPIPPHCTEAPVVVVSPRRGTAVWFQSGTMVLWNLGGLPVSHSIPVKYITTGFKGQGQVFVARVSGLQVRARSSSSRTIKVCT